MVRTRIAPSPTGEDLHIGNVYTALVNFAFAKKNNGKFIIRIEDTDRERLIKGSEEKILNSLKNFGINYDEGPDIGGPFAPYRQSERKDSYKKYALELVDKAYAYFCFCSKERLEEIKKEEEKTQIRRKHWEYCGVKVEEVESRISSGEKYVIRLKSPEKQDISFEDVIRGKITINSDQVDDQVLLKSDGYPTYHLAVVVDDHLMEITHVIRAEEWISSTPKHVLLYQALEWEMPIHAHLPILRNPDKSKLSKRKNPVWASWYLEQGFLPEAILNYLALMGWSHPQGKEIFSMEEFIEKMDLADFAPVGPVFDLTKLEWMNGEYIRRLSYEELTKRLKDYLEDLSQDKIAKLTPLVKERIKKLADFIPLTKFIFNEPEYDMEIFNRLKINDLRLKIEKILESLDKMEKPWRSEIFEQTFRKLAEKENLSAREMFQLIRLSVSGQLVTPPLFESIQIIGEEEVIGRVQKVISDM